MADLDRPTIIEKYANRRLYHAGTYTFVTLDELAAMVKRGRDFLIYNAKAGADITRSVLAQTAFEPENSHGSGMPETRDYSISDRLASRCGRLQRYGGEKMCKACYSLAFCMLFVGAAAHADPITSEGKRLLRALDSMGVDHKWQPGVKVNWQTGQPLAGQPSAYHGTHCAGFVDAVAQKLGVPINGPSDPQINPNADQQAEWLGSAGASSGWHKLDGPVAAQFAANHGELVIAALDDSPRIGHSAIVRPANKSEAEISANGPQETQAGGVNERDTYAADGFRRHSNPLGRIQYFGHAVNW